MVTEVKSYWNTLSEILEEYEFEIHEETMENADGHGYDALYYEIHDNTANNIADIISHPSSAKHEFIQENMRFNGLEIVIREKDELEKIREIAERLQKELKLNDVTLYI